jgi:hypothetical protein
MRRRRLEDERTAGNRSASWIWFKVLNCETIPCPSELFEQLRRSFQISGIKSFSKSLIDSE